MNCQFHKNWKQKKQLQNISTFFIFLTCLIFLVWRKSIKKIELYPSCEIKERKIFLILYERFAIYTWIFTFLKHVSFESKIGSVILKIEIWTSKELIWFSRKLEHKFLGTSIDKAQCEEQGNSIFNHCLW